MARKKKVEKFRVWYVQGGEDRFRWMTILGVFAKDEARQQALDLHKMGYRALILEENQSPPETFWATQKPEDFVWRGGWMIRKELVSNV